MPIIPRDSHSPYKAKIGNFTLSFWRGWQRNEPKPLVYRSSHCRCLLLPKSLGTILRLVLNGQDGFKRLTFRVFARSRSQRTRRVWNADFSSICSLWEKACCTETNKNNKIILIVFIIHQSDPLLFVYMYNQMNHELLVSDVCNKTN